MSENKTTVPIGHAREILADQVRLFCNSLQSRVTEAPLDWWVREFRDWQEFDNPGARYRREMEEIANGR